MIISLNDRLMVTVTKINPLSCVTARLPFQRTIALSLSRASRGECYFGIIRLHMIAVHGSVLQVPSSALTECEEKRVEAVITLECDKSVKSTTQRETQDK